MYLMWIKPSGKPIPPTEVEDLSPSGMLVLRALERRFQPQNANFYHQPPRPYFQDPSLRCFGVHSSQSTLQPRSLSQEPSFMFRPQNPSMLMPQVAANQSCTRSSEQHYVSSVSRSYNHCNDSLHIPSEIPLSLGGDESTWEELSDILAESTERQSRHTNEFSSPNSSPKVFNRIPSNNRSPISFYDMSEPERASSLLDGKGTWPEPNLDRNAIINLTHANVKRNFLFGEDDTLSVDGLSPKNCVGSSPKDDIRCMDVDTDNISLYGSAEDTADISLEENLQLALKKQSSIKSPEKKEIESNRSTSEVNIRQQHEGIRNEKLKKNDSSFLFEMSFSSTENLTPPVSVPSSPKGAASDSDCNHYDTLNSTDEDGVSKSRAQEKRHAQSPFFPGLTTPHKKAKKFLGTPFQRALSSSCISSKACPEEADTLDKGESLQLENKLTEFHVQELNADFCNPRESQIDLVCTLSEEADKNHTTVPKKSPDPKPIQYFPIFQSSSQNKYKSDKEEPVSEPLKSCKKKLKFVVPYKNKENIGFTSTSKSIQELAAKLTKQGGKKPHFEELSEKLAVDVTTRMEKTPPQETSLTLQYKQGFCQLNRPKTCKSFHPDKVLLQIVWDSQVQYISLPLVKNYWSILFIKKLFSNNTRKICFEAQQVIQLFVDKFGVPMNEVSSQWIILDPSIGCWLLNPDEPPHSFTEVLVFLKISENCSGTDMLLSKLSQSAKVLYENLTKNGLWKLFLHIETRITPILACMELHGIEVDVRKLQEMAALLKDRLEAVQRAAYKAAGKQFQLTSTQQLGAILYDQLKLDAKLNISVKETDKRHQKSTSAAMLSKFKDLHPLPGIVLEFRGLHKLKSTYVDAVLGHISGKCIYTTWDQMSAATGRITSCEPNIQTIPKQPLVPDLPLRSAFVARDGYSFLAADFKHIELRVLAHLSKDMALIKALGQTSDVFRVLSQQWLQIPDIHKVSNEDRDKTKHILYALMYGAGPSKLIEILNIDHNEACEIIRKFSGSFPKMQEFTKEVLDKCRKQQFLATETGRRRLFPHITSNNYQLRTYSERQAVNFLIQGTAADLCKCAMVLTQRHLAEISTGEKSLGARLLLQIHDELLWEVPDSELTEVTDVVQDAMERAATVVQSLSSFSVPLPVVMKIGKTWGDMKIVKSASLGPVSQQLET